MKLNLGSGVKYMEGWTNIDANPMENPDIVLDLTNEWWPFDDNSCEKASCSHMLEHISSDPAFYFHFWKELYRVMKHDAEILIIVPHPRHAVFLNDPTHQRVVTPDSLCLFSKSYVEGRGREGIHLTPFYKYLGIDFNVISPIRYVLDPEVSPESNWQEREKHEANIVVEYQMVMQAVKHEEGETT